MIFTSWPLIAYISRSKVPHESAFIEHRFMRTSDLTVRCATLHLISSAGFDPLGGSRPKNPVVTAEAVRRES